MLFDKLLGKKKLSDNDNEILRIHKELVVLIILDGLGIHPDPVGNAVLKAHTPFLDTIWTKANSTLLHASGVHVGLPELENGNSEVGHLNIGVGQVVYQSLPRINDAIRNKRFNENPVLKDALEEAQKRGKKIHLMGLLSDGGVHSHIDHLFALLDLCKEAGVNPYLHVFLDGRDTGPTDGYKFISDLMSKFRKLGIGSIASMSGRLYGMDRDKRWERTQAAYDAMTGVGEKKSKDPVDAVQKAYQQGENDQIFTPTMLVDQDEQPIGPIQSEDVVLFFNFREDRARQITKAFVLEDFEYIERKADVEDLYFVTMTGYEDGLPTKVIFPPKKIEKSLARILSEKGLKQLHISETEKFMHVTYFFNGGYEEPHEGEDFFNIPSPKVFDYSQTPKMSGEKLRDEVLYRLDKNKDFDYSFVVVNFPNPDMLGHTGNLEKTIEAVGFVDTCVRDIVNKTLKLGGCVMVVADHGNCETMIDRDTGKVNTYHTNNPVPFILVSDPKQCKHEKNENILKLGTGRDVPTSGLLADLAPTILAVLGLEPVDEMTGLNLLEVL